MGTNKTTVSIYADDELLAALNSFKESGNHKSLNMAITAILQKRLFGDTQSNVQSALDIQAKDPNFVSIRLPDDVANWLREYATDHNLIRANKPNMGGSIISVIRAAMQGQSVSSDLKQDVRQSDLTQIEAIAQNVIAPLIARINSLESEVSNWVVSAKKLLPQSQSVNKIESSGLESVADLKSDQFETVDEFADRMRLNPGYIRKLIHERLSEGEHYVNMDFFGSNNYRVDVKSTIDFIRRKGVKEVLE